MKDDYLPNAPFDVNDEPRGDKRWFNQALYLRHGWHWLGKTPSKYSPHTGTEEREIQEAILTGKLKPRNEHERKFRDQIALPRPKEFWPEKWVTCKICGCDWKQRGFPAGKQNKFTDHITSHQLVDESGMVWLWPNICQPCGDKRDAKPRKAEKPKLRDPSESRLAFPVGDSEK